MSDFTVSSRSALRAASTTDASCAAHAFAIATPSPLLAPVTTIVLPVSNRSQLPSLLYAESNLIDLI